MSHQPCDSREDTGAVCTLGWERRGHKPRSAHEGSVHSVPYTEGVPGDIYIGGFRSALLAAFFLFAVLGSLHGAFTCAYLEISNLT